MARLLSGREMGALASSLAHVFSREEPDQLLRLELDRELALLTNDRSSYANFAPNWW